MEREEVYKLCHHDKMELFPAGLGNAGGHVIGLFLILCLGAAVTIVVGWVFVQILLWAE